jgi:hypothetical protein
MGKKPTDAANQNVRIPLTSPSLLIVTSDPIDKPVARVGSLDEGGAIRD